MQTPKLEGKTTLKAAYISSFVLLIATVFIFLVTVLASQKPTEKVNGSNNEVNEPTNNSGKKARYSIDATTTKEVELKIGDIGSFEHQGTTYKWKVMNDGKKWLISNLNIKVDNSWCYENDSNYCEAYGRLYAWDAAKEACLRLGNDWRLPSDEDWKKLAIEYGGYHDWKTGRDIGNPMKSYHALKEGGDSDFAAQFGGWRNPSGNFDYLGEYGIFWSNSLRDSSDAQGFGFYRKHNMIARGNGDWYFGHSVRCIQDL